MKIPKPILLYLLSLEMLPLLDELNAGASIKKAVRTIEGFAANSFKEIEKHTRLAPVVNDEMVQQFSKMIDDFECNSNYMMLLCLAECFKAITKNYETTNSIGRAIDTVISYSVKNIGLGYLIFKYVEQFSKMIDEIEIQELKK